MPEEDVLGEVGEGWRQVTSSLNAERVMVAAICTGILQGVLEDAVAYAMQRHAFGKPIGQMQAIQHGIADIAMKLDTARLLTYRAACLEQMATFKVPRYVRFVSEWPMSGTKIQKGRLRQRIAEELAAGSVTEAPRLARPVAQAQE